MAVAVRQQTANGTFGLPLLAGSAVLMGAAADVFGGGPISTSAPTIGGSAVTGSQLAQVQNAVASSPVVYQSAWLLPNVVGGGTALGITVTGGFLLNLLAYEVTGLPAAPALDAAVPNPQVAQGVNITGEASGATGALAGPPGIVIGWSADTGASPVLPGAPWTTQTDAAHCYSGYQLPGAAGGTYNWNPLTAGTTNWASLVLAIAGPAAGPPARLALPLVEGDRSAMRKVILW